MQIREFAETILYGRDLEAKLLEPVSVLDTRPGLPVELPHTPGRTPSIGFSRSHESSFAIPSRAALEGERCRGQVLHSFANHELLALEIMAAMLVRFPEAPKGFRRGLVSTMQDEQRHLRLYLERMNAFGVALGDFGLNRFFWDCLREVSSPFDFVTGMSLTFEQANLDFSQYWMGRFAEIGDEETRGLLHRVYDDEIRHVRHGLHWFRD